MFGVGLTLPKVSAVLLNAIGGLLAAYKINDLTPDLVADFNGSLNDGTEFYNAGGTVDTFAELITHNRAGNATMTDGYGPELASNVAADWVPFGGGSAVQDGEWIVITGASASSTGVTLPLATEVGKQYAWTMEIELLTATVFLTQLQQPTNSADAFSPTSFNYVNTNRTIIYQGIHTHTTAGSRLSAWPSGVGLTARIRNVSVREVPAIKWAPHNLVTYSEDLSNAAWVKNNVTVTANATVAPDGSMTADKIVATVDNGNIRQGLTAPTVSNTARIFSLVDGSAGSSPAGAFDSISVTSVGNGWWHIEVTKGTITYAVFAKAAEWDYISVQTLSGPNLYIYPSQTSSSSGTADGTSGIYIWGAHAYRSDLGGMVDNPETGDSYVPTTSSAVYLPRRNHHVYNGSAWVNEGVLHESEARTNLIEYSTPDASNWTITAVTLTADDAVSPDGTENAARINETTASSGHNIQANSTNVTSGLDYTLSAYFKADTSTACQLLFSSTGFVGSSQYASFDLSTGTVGYEAANATATIQDVGNDWYRCAITSTANATVSSNIGFVVFVDNDPASSTRAPVYAGDTAQQMYVYGVQVEQASTPSSYIPTSGSTVSRALETLTIPAANMPWPEPNYIGPELVTNGDFSNGTTGWTAQDAILSVVDGELLVTADGTLQRAYQAITVESGKAYLVSGDATNGSGSALLRIGTSIGSSAYALQSGTGNISQVVVASSSSLYITASAGATYDNISIREIDPLSVSIQMQGRMTYADNNDLNEVNFVNWVSGAKYIRQLLRTDSTKVGLPYIQQNDGTSLAVINAAPDPYLPGVFVPFNIATRHTSVSMGAGIDGVVYPTFNGTITSLPDLSTTPLTLGYDYMGTISMLRVWADDLADAGIAEASEPSEVPSLQLTFDNSETSFTIQDWEQ